MKIISHRQWVESVSYSHSFRWAKERGAGFGFDCGEDGKVPASMNNCAAENLMKCLDGTYAVTDEGVTEYRNRYLEPAVGRCDCGLEVVLRHFTNTCDCGADYNSSGQRLADRSQWGEETGESVSDILAIN